MAWAIALGVISWLANMFGLGQWFPFSLIAGDNMSGLQELFQQVASTWFFVSKG